MSASARAVSVTVTVPGTAGPWQFSQGGINDTYPYDFNIGDFTAPTAVTPASRLSFAAGQMVTIDYVSGLVSIGGTPLQPSTDANGDTSYPRPTTVGFFASTPSMYFTSPLTGNYFGELVGTFAGPGGAIVGTPFKVGDAATETVPTGAAELLLGVNDNGYIDNLGSWQVNVSESGPVHPVALPPAALQVLLMLAGLAGVGAVRSKWVKSLWG
jgi:hypothetical protein